MRISVLTPTYRRPEFLAKALAGLDRQERPPDQIVIGTRKGDAETHSFLAGKARSDRQIEIAETAEPGVIAAMSAASLRTQGEIVCLLDDDAEPLPDWIKRIEVHFERDPGLGFLGGRDLLQDHPAMRKAEKTTRAVGIFTPYGRILGNHHKGHGPARRVDFLKGCNAAIRGGLLRQVGFESRLRGEGAQVHWEMALCLDVARAGYHVTYDPAVQVIHHIAPRFGVDQSHRGGFSEDGLFDMVWNEHFVVASRAGRLKRASHLTWSLLVGSADAPGALRYFPCIVRGDKFVNVRIRTALRAIREARQAARLIRVNPDEDI